MMMRDAAQDHHEHQQRKERYGNGKIPNWTAFMHVTKVTVTPNPNHIRRTLSGPNGLLRVCRNPSRLSKAFGKPVRRDFRELIRLFERLFYHGHAFFHALAQRAFDFLLTFAQRERFVGDIQRGEHRDLQ